MALKLSNLAATRLASNISADDAFVQVEDASAFPALTDAADWFPVAVVNDSAQTEFMRAVGLTGNTLRVVRAQEGSIARAYLAGDVLELRLTVAALEEIRQQGAA